MIRTVVLHGDLATTFGGRHRFDVADVPGALRACMQFKGFRKRIADGDFHVLVGKTEDGKLRACDLSEKTLALQLGTTMPEIHLVPVIAGAGGRGLWQIIIGTALIAAAIFLPPLSITLPGALGTIAVNTVLGGIGASLALGGISQMLARPAELTGGNADKDRAESFLFGSQTNRATQGGPVPIVFGRRVRTGGVIVSVGLSSQQI